MEKNDSLFRSANWIILLGVVAALLAAQWKHEAVPLFALAIIMLLIVVKARLIVLDFMFLRGAHSSMAPALIAWAGFFALAGFARAILPIVS